MQQRTSIGRSLAMLIAPLMGFVFMVRCPTSAQNGSSARNVLVLYSFSDPNLFSPLDSLKSEIRARAAFPVNFYAEYMDTQRFEDAAYEQSVSESFRHAYGGQKIDLVMVAAYPALHFALQHREQIFPGVPIVFFYVHGGRFAGGKPPPGATGVTKAVDVSGSLKLAFQLQPATQHVAVVTGTTEFETYWLGVFRREFTPYRDKARLTELVALPSDEVLRQLASLPANTVVFVQLSPQSSKQPVLGTYDGAYDLQALISQRYSTYCIFSSLCLGRGGIGGSYADDDDQVRKAAELASRILAGESPDQVPILQADAAQVRVDWRQLRRWNIAESALPPDSLILYRPTSLWQRHRDLILILIGFVALEAALIVGLLGQRAKKRKVEINLEESEGRFQAIAEAAPALIWMSDESGRITYLNGRSFDFTGAPVETLLGDGWVSCVHPEDLSAVTTGSSLTVVQYEPSSEKYRLRRKDGVYRWMLDVRSPRFHPDGLFAGFIGSAVDISDQHTAQEALEMLGGRLIEAQEQERSRIARELHDDICQRLAILTVEIEQSMNSSNGTSAQIGRMQEVWHHCSEITGDVQALSHELHSSMLDHLGIVAATRNFCSEFSEQHGVVISFQHADVPSNVPRNIALCLFRVAQEALHNAVKHSGVRTYQVKLTGGTDRLELEIHDAGKGFDPERVKRNGGLGLISMEERVHLLKGIFAIESGLNNGTSIRAILPLARTPDPIPPVPEIGEKEQLQHAARSNYVG